MYKREYSIVNKKFKEYLLPTLFTSMAGNICQFVDSLVVSALLGAVCLSAIQLASPVITFVNMIYWMIGLGGSTLCAVAKAGFNKERANSIFGVSIVSLISFGVVATVVGVAFQNQIVGFLCSGNGEVFEMVHAYYLVLVLGLPLLCYLMSMSYFVRLDGNPKMAFRAILISNLVNLAMDLFFMGILHLGIGGASLATVVGYFCGCVYITGYFFKDSRTLKPFAASSREHGTGHRLLVEICTLGFPGASTQLFITLVNLIYNAKILAMLGAGGIVAFSACNNVLYIIYIFFIGAAQTMAPIVSIYYKQEDYGGVRFVVHKACRFVIVASGIITLIILICPQTVLLLYHVKGAGEIALVSRALRLYAISYVGLAITFLFTFYAQAIQRKTLSLIVSIIEGFAGPFIFLFLLTNLIGADGIWLAYACSELVTLLFMFMYSRYVRRKTKGEFSGLFICRTPKEGQLLEMAIDIGSEQIPHFSMYAGRQLEELGISNKLATIVNLALEEMLVNIATRSDAEKQTQKHKNGNVIDVLLKIHESEILISVTDEGTEFNPIADTKDDGYSFDNISVLNRIADKIDYSRVLGMNNTVIVCKERNRK